MILLISKSIFSSFDTAIYWKLLLTCVCIFFFLFLFHSSIKLSSFCQDFLTKFYVCSATFILQLTYNILLQIYL